MASPDEDSAKDSQVRRALRCVAYGGGICLALGVYGMLQERIMSEPYGDETFRVSVFLVFCNRAAAILYAAAMVMIKGESYAHTVPLWKYIAVSMSNVTATWCQYEALKYVSFPVQMLGKSFKMMPVMMWGILISGQKYKLMDWAVAAGVTGGVTSFLMTGTIKAKHADQGSSVYGLLLLCCFLAFDGFTSTFQEKLFKEHKTSKYNQMLYVNGASSVVSAATLLVTGGGAKALGFIARHPSFIGDASILSASAVGGQFFIYSMVKEFGALALAAAMNIRQVASILNSYFMYAHPITLLQVLSLAVVFAALFYKSYLSYLKNKEKANTASSEAQVVGKSGEVGTEAEVARMNANGRGDDVEMAEKKS